MAVCARCDSFLSFGKMNSGATREELAAWAMRDVVGECDIKALKKKGSIAREEERIRKKTAGMTDEEKQAWLAKYAKKTVLLPRDPSEHMGHTISDPEKCSAIIEAQERLAQRVKDGEDPKEIYELVEGVGKLKVHDGCERDEKGWVAPKRSCFLGVNPPKPKPPPIPNQIGLVGYHVMPEGSTLEDAKKVKPAQSLLDAWSRQEDLAKSRAGIERQVEVDLSQLEDIEEAKRLDAELRAMERFEGDPVEKCRQAKRIEARFEKKKQKRKQKLNEDAQRKKEAAERAALEKERYEGLPTGLQWSLPH